jgi:hypothetical protein
LYRLGIVSRVTWVLGLLLSLSSATGCPSDGPTFLGEPGAPVQAILDSNLFFVPTVVDGETGPHLAVDTGAPTVVVAPGLLNATGPGLNTASSFEMLGLDFVDFQYIGETLLSSDMNGFVAGGVVGCTAFCVFDLSLDYRTATLTLDARNPTETMESYAIPFSFEGGGRARDPVTDTIYDVPRSRVIVDASVEGNAVRLLVDTGASSTVIRAGLAEQLTADGRPTLDAPAVGMFGMDTASLFRVREVKVADATVEEPIVAKSPAFEALLDGIEEETGARVDGVVGGTVLREFYVTISYAAETLHLDRYATREHVRDEALRIGVLVTRVRENYVEVGEVIAGTDAAAQGVAIADRITAIDGEQIEGKTDQKVAEMLSGAKGLTRAVTFGCPGCPGYQGVRTIAVDYDALALP